MKTYFTLKSVGGTFFSNLFIQIITVIQGILIARLLGVEGRGEYTAIIMWPNFFAGIFAFGTYTGIGIIAAKKENLGNIYPSILILSLMTGFLGCLFAYFSIPFLLGKNGTHLVNITRIFSIFIIINHIGRSLLAIDHGVGNFKNYNILRSIVNPIYLSLLLLVVLLSKLTVYNSIILLLIANVIVVLIRFLLVFKQIDFKSKIYSIKKIFKKSFSFGLADMAMPVYQYLDKAILLWLLGTISLGYYVVALTAAGVLNIISQTIATISFTQVAKDKQSSNKVITVFRLTVICYLLFGIGLSLLLPYLIPLVYGKDFSPSIMPAIILIIASFFQGQGNILEQALRGAGKAFVGLEGRLGSIIIMVLLGFVFSQYFGLIGIVWAFVIAQLMFFIIIAKRFIQFFKPELSLIPNVNDVRMLIDVIKLKLQVLK